MNVWLINPRTDDMIEAEVPGYVSREVGRFPPLGLLYLAAAVRAAGRHAVRVLDMPARNLSYAALGAELARGRPDVVGITAITHNLIGVRKAAACARAALPDVPLCMGGPHVDAFPAEAAELAPFDYAFRGEAEQSFARFVDALAAGAPPDDIPGLCRRAGDRTVTAPAAPPPARLDDLPLPARDLVNAADYYYVLGKRATFTTLMSSRGCPFRCIFCSTSHERYRVRSAAALADEIESCRAGGAEEFHFLDDTFNVHAGRLAEISAELRRRGLNVRWSFRGRADRLDPESLRAARAAGCTRMHLGIESGDDEGLRELRKEITVADAERALRDARRAGISTAAYFLVGCPHERTRADVLRGIRAACRLNPDFAMFNILSIYPHTELFDRALEKGLVDAGYWRDFARDPRPGFRMRFWEEHFTREELIDLLQTAYRRFYLRPSVVWRELRALGSPSELKHKAGAAASIAMSRFRPHA